MGWNNSGISAPPPTTGPSLVGTTGGQASQIRLNADELNKIIDQITAEVETIQQEVKTHENLVRELEDGSAMKGSITYVHAVMAGVTNASTRLKTEFEQITAIMREAASRCSETETKFNKKFEGLVNDFADDATLDSLGSVNQ